MAFLTKSGANLQLNGSTVQLIGFNYYPALVDMTSLSTMRSLLDALAKRSEACGLLRTWCFPVEKPPTNANGNIFYESGGTMYLHETTAVQLDNLLYEANKRGIKLVLSLADNTSNYNTKSTYVTWANNVYSAGLSTAYPYVGFFNSSDCRNIYESNFSTLANRTNTIDGIQYKNHPGIAWWELGNELRYDVFDAEGGTQNTASSTNIANVMNWADDMAGRMKVIDTNHLVSFSSVAHTWNWTNGDTVSNGSGYGACYLLFPSLVNVDILDFHHYPTQGGGEVQILKYGQRLGYANAITGDGLRAQLRDFVDVIRAGNKIAGCGEVGFVREVAASTQYFPLYPRHDAIKEIMDILFERGISYVLPWSATVTGGGSYSIGLDESGTRAYWGSNANSNDATLMEYIKKKNTQLNYPGKRSRIT